MDTSSALMASSAMMRVGLHDQRARDAHALALAAGELVRVAVGVLGGQADLAQHGQHHVAPLRARFVHVVDVDALGDDVDDLLARVE